MARAPHPQSVEVDGFIITKHDVMEYYISRAMKAYARSGGIDQPSSAHSSVCDYKGRRYIRLVNVNGPLAVYRITGSLYTRRDDSMGFRLRMLKRWHRALVHAPEPTGLFF